MAVTPAIEIRGVSKSFVKRRGVPSESELGEGHWLAHLLLRSSLPPERFQALRGIDLTIGQGEFFGILGPNGAGKTTLLKCITTLLLPDSGTIAIHGLDSRRDTSRVKTLITLVGSGQWVAFDWGLTVKENLHFFGDLYGIPRRVQKQRIAEALHLVRLEHKAEATTRTLSAGERQKMVLARGLIIRTPIMLLDEPTANLDPVSTSDLLKYISNDLVNLSGVTCVFTTHRTEEAERLCNRVAILNHGSIAALGTPKELRKIVADVEYLELDFIGLNLDIEDRVRSLPGVLAAVIQRGPARANRATLRIKCENAELVSGVVLEAIASCGATALAIRHSTPRLSDVFMAVAGKGIRQYAI